MGKSLKLAIVGGDERQAYLARLAQADGHSIRTFALERAENVPRSPDLASCLAGADAVLLPVPVTQGESLLRAPLSDTKTDIMQVLDAIPSGTLTLGGAVPFRLHARAVQNGVRLTDCLAREELAIRNAVPTCEGALQIAMEQTDRTIQGARALVVGAGRIGFLLAQRLHALGAEVTVSVRSLRDRARIEAQGWTAVETAKLAEVVPEMELIFNTVPAPVLTNDAMRALLPPCIVIDLASLPGGVAPDAEPAAGCRVLHALSLPGKVAPRSAAEAIYMTVTAILREEGLL